MATIEITFENSTFHVNFKVNANNSEIIGYNLDTLREAIVLAESYQRMDNSISIEISPYTKESMNPYKEFGNIAKTIGLAANSFDGLVDTLIEYRNTVKPELRSKKDVLDILKPNNVIN